MINKQNFYIGAAFLCLGLIIVPVNDALAKVLSSDLNIMEVIWSRFFGHFVFLVPIALFIHGKNKFINKETNQQIIRGFLIFIGTALFYLAISKIKRNNPEFTNIDSIESFIGSKIYKEISSGEFHDKWLDELKKNDFIDKKTKKKG